MNKNSPDYEDWLASVETMAGPNRGPCVKPSCEELVFTSQQGPCCLAGHVQSDKIWATTKDLS